MAKFNDSKWRREQLDEGSNADRWFNNLIYSYEKGLKSPDLRDRAERKLFIKQVKDFFSKVREGINEADKFSSQGMWKDTKMFPITRKINVRNMRNGALVHFTGHSSGAKGETWKKRGNVWICIYGDGVKGNLSGQDAFQSKLKFQGRIQINAGKEEKDVDLDKVFMKGITKKRWTETTSKWKETLKKLAGKEVLNKLSKSDKDKLLRIALMLKKEKP